MAWMRSGVRSPSTPLIDVITPRAGALLALVTLVSTSCDRHATVPVDVGAADAQPQVLPNEWPPLPNAPAGVTAVVRDRGNRPEAPRVRPTVEAIQAKLGDPAVVAGDAAIASVLDGWVGAGDKPSFVVFGSFHDASAQLDEFRRVVTRMPKLWGVVLEQFKARGAWLGAPDVPPTDGDEADLAEFFATGSDAPLWRLREAQLDHDYAAWKFDYVAHVLDVVIALRGVGKPVFACDMPKRLLDPSLEGTPDAITLREAHCAISAREALRTLGPAHVAKGELYVDDVPPPMRAAFFVGDDHAGIGGLPRFLHETARIASVHLYGGRPDPELPKEMTVVDPVLVPLGDKGGGAEFALLLPNVNPAGALVDRVVDRDAKAGGVRPAADGTISAPTVWLESDGAVRVALAGADVAVGKAGEWLRVRPGVHACTISWPTPGKTTTFALDVPTSGVAKVVIDAVGIRVSRQ